MNILELKTEKFGERQLTFIDIDLINAPNIKEIVVDWLDKFDMIETREYQELKKIVITIRGNSQNTQQLLKLINSL